MEFSVSEKYDTIYVRVLGPDPWRPQTFYPLIDRLHEQIQDAYLQKKHMIVFDFLRLNFVDSYMISLLVQTSRLTEPERNVILVSDNQISAIIQLIGVDKIFNIYESREKWLNATEITNGYL